MRYLIFALVLLAACNDRESTENVGTDTMPTVKPDVIDTSRVVTPPPTGDSNVVHPDTTIQSR
jgi:hypothetical protein